MRTSVETRDYVEEEKHPKDEKERGVQENSEGYVTMTNRESKATIFREYETAEIDSFRTIDYVPNSKIDAGIINVIKTEGPVHREVIYRRFSEAKKRGQPYSNVRLSVTDKRVIDIAISRLKSQLVRTGDIFTIPGQELLGPRNAGDRSINEISPKELGLALITTLKNCCGVSREDLIRTTAQLLGYERFGANIRETLNWVYDGLKSNGQLKEVDGVVLL